MRMLTRIALMLAAALLLLPAASADRITNLLSASESEAALAERAGLPATLAGLDDELPSVCVRPAHPHFPVFLEGDDEPAFWMDDGGVPFDNDDPPPLDELPWSDGDDGTPVAAVPEPGTLALFGSGLIAIGVGVRQRLKRSG